MAQLFRLPALLLSLTGLLCIGCSPQPESGGMSQSALMDSLDVPDHVRQLDSLTVFDANRPPSHTATLELDLTYDSVPAPMAHLGGGLRMVVDSQGRVFLKDLARRSINVFGHEGSLSRTVGREGRGPGEFVSLGSLALSNGQLAVYDMFLKRVQYFSLESLTPGQTLNLDADDFDALEDDITGTIIAMWSLNGRKFLIQANGQRRDERLYRNNYVMNGEGEVISGNLFESVSFDTYTWGGGGKRIYASDHGMVATSYQGKIYKANSAELLIQEIDPDDGKMHSIYYPYPNVPLVKEEALEVYGTLSSTMRNADFPDYWPAMESMFVDDKNRIWVSTITEDRETYTWWVLHEDGSLAARLVWPREKMLKVGRNGYVYALIEDYDGTGMAHVERYRLHLTPIN